MDFIDFLLQVTLIYLLAGLAFGIYFIFFGAAIIVDEIKGTNIKFKLLILPGSMVLWPYLIFRIVKTKFYS